MARLARLTLPGLPHHVIQRGNNGQPVFADDQDREALLTMLADSASREQVQVHAYVLMDNHFHLLLTPQTAEGVPRLMQALGRAYVRYFNARHGRMGTLWEGRYRSTLIQPERHLLDCMVYMDLNPVRSAQVVAPADHRWSSHAHYIGARQDRLVTPHPQVWALGNTPFAREAAYAQRVQAGLSAAKERALTQSALRGWALGDAGFLASLQQQTPRRLTPGRPGRPANAARSR